MFRMVRGHVGYALTAFVVIFCTMYLCMRILHWGLFLSAPVASILGVSIATLVRKRLDRADAMLPRSNAEREISQ